jgi:TolB-like protein
VPLLALLFIGSDLTLRAAESNAPRVAVGPFFAPVGNDRLRQASQVLPELLVAELSDNLRFQLVERDKVQAVWSELNLNASGLVARDTVAKLGRVLACDWLVSGSLVEAGGRTRVWTKVIDVRTGVVLDLNAAPFEAGAFTNTVASIAAFLAKTGTQPKGRQFIAIGPFVDMNPPTSTKREDWSRRIAALIEKHFLEAGFGVVEIAAVGPIFEERRLETAGLTGNPEGRVKLQAAFWLVDGGCEWAAGDGDKLRVGLRVQQVGGPEQMYRVTEPAGEEIEKAVIATITRALANTNLFAQASPNAEADLLAARGMELATRRSPFRPNTSQAAKTQTIWDSYQQVEEQNKRGQETRNAAIATYERTLLRDPKNLEAKTMLGYALLGELDSAKREHGKELLREVVASKDPKYADRAQRHLNHADLLARAGQQMAQPAPRPKDWRSVNQAVADNPNDLEAKCDLGAMLLELPRKSDRERGRKMLAEVAAGDRPDQAERARKLLAQPEKYPAVADDRPPAASAAKPASDTPPQEDARVARRREFFQQNLAKFIPAKFEKDGPQLALIQRVAVKDNLFDYEGKHYCGFRFTAPPWMDGDLQWMHILAKTEVQKDFSARGFEWYIIPKSGRMKGFEDYNRLRVEDYQQLARRFPNTKTVFRQNLPWAYIRPGEEYAIWFGFEESDLPDIAFAITIASHRGYSQFGILPLQ